MRTATLFSHFIEMGASKHRRHNFASSSMLLGPLTGFIGSPTSLHCADLDAHRLKHIPGSSVEHNTFCVSAHFRNCPVSQWQQVVSAVEAVVARNQDLRITRGRKVLEVRPKVSGVRACVRARMSGEVVPAYLHVGAHVLSLRV